MLLGAMLFEHPLDDFEVAKAGHFAFPADRANHPHASDDERFAVLDGNGRFGFPRIENRIDDGCRLLVIGELGQGGKAGNHGNGGNHVQLDAVVIDYAG